MKYSIIIPVYNSEKIVEDTVNQTIQALNKDNITHEIMLINDCSTDNSWNVIKNLAEKKPEVIAINFLKNYGQHTAVLAGIKHASGDFMITMDDDLQNPPKEIIKLINKAKEGYELVFAVFREKKHSLFRKLGTKVIDLLNKKVFGKPNNIKLTNFRIFSREVAQRLLEYRTSHPYIPGLLLMHASDMANVETEHHPRAIGKSNYSLLKILKLVGRLLFNYSSYPIKTLAFIGIFISLISFLYGSYSFISAIFFKAPIPGWTSIIVLISFFNGFVILMLATIGEYIVRLMNQVSTEQSYQIKKIVGQNEL